MNSCVHCFCYECILRWSQVGFTQTENRCPECKARFSSLKRKCHRVEYRSGKNKAVKAITDKDQGSNWSIMSLISTMESVLGENFHIRIRK